MQLTIDQQRELEENGIIGADLIPEIIICRVRVDPESLALVGEAIKGFARACRLFAQQGLTAKEAVAKLSRFGKGLTVAEQQCTVCGVLYPEEDIIECEECSDLVCTECYDHDENMCTDCRGDIIDDDDDSDLEDSDSDFDLGLDDDDEDDDY